MVETWNIRIMNFVGKLENIKCEKEQNNIDILDLCEIRWPEEWGGLVQV